MEADYSKAALERFLQFVEEKGLVSHATAQGWRVATAKITDDLSASEQADVRQIDVENAFKRFNNKNANRYTPKTLGEYRKRAGSAIENFVKWADAPEAYQPKGRVRTSTTKRQGSQPRKSPRPEAIASSRTESPAPSQPRSGVDPLALPFPIRPGMLAHISVPRDMKLEEAKRLAAFLLTLAMDYRAPD